MAVLAKLCVTCYDDVVAMCCIMRLWCGVVWCGVVWCGGVVWWCGVVVWCGVVWCDVV